MRSNLIAVTLGATTLLGSCVPAGGNFQGGGRPGGGFSGGPGPGVRYPVATADEIIRFVSGASTYIESFCDWGLCQLECGFFDPNGSYESIAYSVYGDGSYSYDEWYEFYGSWSARDGELCIQGSWDDGEPGLGCMLAEWNTTDDALLLIDRRDEVAAVVTTFPGPGAYYDDCSL